MSRKKISQKRREYTAELKDEAVQMLMDGHYDVLHAEERVIESPA